MRRSNLLHSAPLHSPESSPGRDYRRSRPGIGRQEVVRIHGATAACLPPALHGVPESPHAEPERERRHAKVPVGGHWGGCSGALNPQRGQGSHNARTGASSGESDVESLSNDIDVLQRRIVELGVRGVR